MSGVRVSSCLPYLSISCGGCGFAHRFQLPIRLPNKLFQHSALSLKLVFLEAMRVVAEHVEVRPPQHRTNDLRILVVSHEPRRERMPESVEAESLDQFPAHVRLSVLDLNHSGSDRSGLEMIRHDHRPATRFASLELPRCK